MNRLPAFWGVLLAGATIGVHMLLGREASVLIASLLIAMIGAVYAGFAVSESRASAIIIESIGALGFAAAGLGGMLVSPWFIVAALIGHACWDAFHHLPGKWAKPPKWYIPYCVCYDVCAGIGLAILWFERGFLSL